MPKGITNDMAVVVAKLHEQDILAPSILNSDGKWNNCPTADKPKKMNGRYLVKSNSPLRVAYINHRTGNKGVVSSDGSTRVSKAEQREIAQHIKKEDEKVLERQAEAAEKAVRMFKMGKKCKTHPYLEKKGVKPCPGLKIDSDSGRLMVPFRDENGDITTLQFINDDGGFKPFIKGGKKKGSFFPIGDFDDSKTILIVEGLVTGLSEYESTDFPVVVAGDAGNLYSVALKIRALYPDHEIIFGADNDIHEDNSPNRGLADANAAAFAIKALVAVPKLESGEKCDFNDVHQKEGKERVRELISNAMPPFNIPEVDPLPRDYSYRPSGQHLDLYYKDTRLGRAFFVMAESRNKENEGWGRLLVVFDSDNNRHEVSLSNEDLLSPPAVWLKGLANAGWKGVPDVGMRNHLARFISEYETTKRVRLISSVGWYENVYVLPSVVIGEAQKEQPLLYPALKGKFQTKGSLEGWQNTIGTWAVGNSRMTMAICAVLATFLLRYYEWMESFGIHFYGTSSRGKSTSIQGAASCCGSGSLSGGYLNSWLVTANAIEGLAALHRDAPLFLDEMGKADAQTVNHSAYVIAGGEGKVRMNANASMQNTKAWRTIVISTGEKTFEGKLAEVNLQPQAGQTVRFLNIPAPENSEHGFFEDIHDHASGVAFADAIKQAAVTNYGHIATAFIRKLIEVGHPEIEAQLKDYLDRNITKLCKEDADGQVGRVAKHFLLCAFAGRLAAEWGILPWEKGDASRAVSKCFRGWLAVRGTTGAMEEKDLINRVKRFITAHGDSRFQVVDKYNSLPVRDRVGFKVVVKGETRYLFTKESFQEVICMGSDPTVTAATLQKHGMLKRDNDGYAVKPTCELPDIGRARCYTVVMPNND